MSPKIFNVSPDCEAASLRIIAENIAATIDEDYVLMIDLSIRKYSAADPDGNRVQGVDLLKWLRLKGVLNHTIVTSSHSLAGFIDHDPKNAILGTKGVTFFQLPLESGMTLGPRNLDIANHEQLKEIFKLDLDLRKIRHDAANTFGLYRLRRHHRRIEPDAKFSELSIADELEHEMVRFVFEGADNNPPEDSEIALAKKQLRGLREIEEKRLVFIDDKADCGWSEFLTILLGTSSFRSLKPGKKERPATLSEKVFQFINSKGGWVKFVNSNHLIITDLKLMDSEHDETDYKKLLSYQTVKRLRVDQYGNADDRLRIMYLTASNDLSKMKGILDKKDINPHVIFTKEGADQFLSERESFQKYMELINALKSLLSYGNAAKMVETLQKMNLEEESERRRFVHEHLAHLRERQLFENENGQSKFSEQFAGTAEIFIDSNIFLQERSKTRLIDLILTLPEKIRIPVTVRHELWSIGENIDGIRGVKDVFAAFFGKLIDEMEIPIIHENLSAKQQEIIDNMVHSYYPNFADDQLCELMRNCSVPTVLFSNDHTFVKRVRDLNNKFVVIRNKLDHNKIIHAHITEREQDRGREVERNDDSDAPLSTGVSNNNVPDESTLDKTVDSASFVIGSIAESPLGDGFQIAAYANSPINVFIKKVDFKGVSLVELRTKLYGRVIRADANGETVKQMLLAGQSE